MPPAVQLGAVEQQAGQPESDFAAERTFTAMPNPYVSGWDGTTVKEQVRLIAWGENQETSNNV